jgi:hypothetical protein
MPLPETFGLRLLSFGFFFALGLSAAAQTKSPPAAAVVTCASCHVTESATQSETQMGRAAELPSSNPTLTTHPKMTFSSQGFTYTVETVNGQSRYTVTDGTRSITIPILWSLGSQAQTWVLEYEGKLFESQVSYYPSVNGLEITTGDNRRHPANLEEAVGRLMSEEEAKQCFGCHTTNAIADHKLNLAAAKPGLTCEHCHLGASEHLAGVLQGNLNTVPPRLGKLSAEDTSNFCGQCHRTWETVVRNHWRGQADARFQPYRLANSKCFDGTDRRISCVACHNPHEKLVRNNPAYYDAKCLACHAPLLKPAAATPAATVASSTTTTAAVHGKVCPVAKSDCVSCHMPKVALPNGLVHFSDHQIRIAKAGEPFPN